MYKSSEVGLSLALEMVQFITIPSAEGSARVVDFGYMFVGATSVSGYDCWCVGDADALGFALK